MHGFLFVEMRFYKMHIIRYYSFPDTPGKASFRFGISKSVSYINTMYSAPISEIIEAHGFSSMLYADDTQIYLTFHPQDQQDAIMKLNNCLTDIVSWAQKNMLKINAQTTELLHFSSRFNPSSSPASVMVDGFVVHETPIARNLGVHMDRHLQLREHIKKVCSSSMSALKRIAQIRDFMSTKTTEKFIHAFVTSRLLIHAMLSFLASNQFKIVLQDLLNVQREEI